MRCFKLSGKKYDIEVIQHKNDCSVVFYDKNGSRVNKISVSNSFDYIALFLLFSFI